ncbi:MAG: hypothetical protein AAFV72_19195 [Cyanobacteria bacterium J06635_1]
MTLVLSSRAFTPSGEIPAEYTCEGQDRSPPLVWQGIPEATRSLALIILEATMAGHLLAQAEFMGT